jgi:serine/threonine-protein kinase RsbW
MAARALAPTMPVDHPSKPAPRLTLHSQLGELTLVWPWVESLAAYYRLPDDTQFALQLCLEEALSNVIRHGYGGRPIETPDVTLTIDCALDGTGDLTLTVEDQAPPFNPLALEDAPAPSRVEDLKPGGRGIGLMRKFAGSLVYERLPEGNRLTIRFPVSR